MGFGVCGRRALYGAMDMGYVVDEVMGCMRELVRYGPVGEKKYHQSMVGN